MARALIPLLLLAACAHSPGPIEVRTVTVKVPVPVPCVAASDVPERPAPLAETPRPADARRALDIAVARVLRWEAYGAKADAVMQGCATR